MSKNIPVKDRVANRLDKLREKEGIGNYSDLIEIIIGKAYPQDQNMKVGAKGLAPESESESESESAPPNKGKGKGKHKAEEE